MSDSGHGEKLTRKKELAIVALLTEPTITKAASSAGISEATLRRWMRLDEFGRGLQDRAEGSGLNGHSAHAAGFV